MRGLFDLDALSSATADRRRYPAEIRQAILECKAEYPPLGLRGIGAICRHRFGRSIGHHTIGAVLAGANLSIRPLRCLPDRPRCHLLPP